MMKDHLLPIRTGIRSPSRTERENMTIKHLIQSPISSLQLKPFSSVKWRQYWDQNRIKNSEGNKTEVEEKVLSKGSENIGGSGLLRIVVLGTRRSILTLSPLFILTGEGVVRICFAEIFFFLLLF